MVQLLHSKRRGLAAAHHLHQSLRRVTLVTQSHQASQATPSASSPPSVGPLRFHLTTPRRQSQPHRHRTLPKTPSRLQADTLVPPPAQRRKSSASSVGTGTVWHRRFQSTCKTTLHRSQHRWASILNSHISCSGPTAHCIQAEPARARPSDGGLRHEVSTTGCAHGVLGFPPKIFRIG